MNFVPGFYFQNKTYQSCIVCGAILITEWWWVGGCVERYLGKQIYILWSGSLLDALLSGLLFLVLKIEPNILLTELKKEKVDSVPTTKKNMFMVRDYAGIIE